jgi:hypothetical protein
VIGSPAGVLYISRDIIPRTDTWRIGVCPVMVDLVAKVVWFRICETAEKIITSLDINESSRMDPLGLLLLGWIVLAGIVYFATDYVRDLLNHFRGDVQPPNNQTGRIAAAPPRPALPALHTHTCTPESSISQRPDTLAPSGGGSASSSHPSSETLQARVKLINYSKEGSDWVNSVLNWLYHRYNTTPEFADIWLSALNEHAKRNAQQVGLLQMLDKSRSHLGSRIFSLFFPLYN